MNNTIVVTITGHNAKGYSAVVAKYLKEPKVKELKRKWWQIYHPYEVRAQNVPATSVHAVMRYLADIDAPAKVDLF